jgi:hypothetical protein
MNVKAQLGQREVKQEVRARIKDIAYFTSINDKYPTDKRQIVAVYFTCKLVGTPKRTKESPFGTEWVEDVPRDMFSNCDRRALASFFKEMTQGG